VEAWGDEAMKEFFIFRDGLSWDDRKYIDNDVDVEEMAMDAFRAGFKAAEEKYKNTEKTSVPDGYVLVPCGLTDSIYHAAKKFGVKLTFDAYRAMLKAGA
jgi:hypothetical protein